MSKHSVTRRRLLWAIIHPLPRLCTPLAPIQSLPAHTFHTTSRRGTRSEPSITFGSPETDALIARLAGNSSGSKRAHRDAKKTDASHEVAALEPDEVASTTAQVVRNDESDTHIKTKSGVAIAPELKEYHQWRDRRLEKSTKKAKIGQDRTSQRMTKMDGDFKRKPPDSERMKRSDRKPKVTKDTTKPDVNDESIPFARPDAGQPSAKGKKGKPTEEPSAVPDSKPTFPRRNTANMEPWQIQKAALKEKFQDEAWSPRKKLSPDAQQGIRNLHEQDPERYSTAKLAEEFKVSAEAIRRILKSKWQTQQGPEKMQERRERWAKRHDRIYDQQAALGLRKPRQKDREIEDPDAFEEDLRARQILEAARNA